MVDRRKLPKTVSARIENNMHEELIDRCNKVGCRVSDFVKASVEFCLYGYAEFDFGDEDGEEQKTDEKPEAHTPRIHYIERPTSS